MSGGTARRSKLESFTRLQQEDPLNDRAVEQMLVGVSTRKYARSHEPVIQDVMTFGTSKSAVIRRFVAKTRSQLEAALSRPLGDRSWTALLIDGICFHEHVVLLVVGIDESGQKHLIAFREGTTENATLCLCREMLSDIVDRGVRADRSILVVMDGGKGLRKAVLDVFGQYALVQRCQVHKKRNVLEYAPNTRNPSGFQEVKRVDVTGKAHRNPDGTVVPTPHVKEAGVKGVRPATPDELP